jgi:branched-chain amino acid transport system permease protein/neutral amino acid transport system permease protein
VSWVAHLGSAIGFGLVTASILALAAVGFTLQFAVTNVLNLAFAEWRCWRPMY